MVAPATSIIDPTVTATLRLRWSAPFAQDDAAVLVLQFSSFADSSTDRFDPKKHGRFHASDAKSAHVARQEVGASINRIVDRPEETFTSEFIVGELLANTVQHAPGLVDLTLESTAEDTIVPVRDRGPGLTTNSIALPDDVMRCHRM